MPNNPVKKLENEKSTTDLKARFNNKIHKSRGQKGVCITVTTIQWHFYLYNP